MTSTDGFVSTTPAGADGTWSVALNGLAATEVHSLTVVQEQAGRVSSPSTTPLGPYTFELPRVVSPAPGATITGRVQERSGTEPLYAIDVEFAGSPGFVVEAFVDDRPTGNLHTLGAQPLVRQVSGLAPGKHTFGLRYVGPDAVGTPSFGPMTAITFTVTAP
ncbi:hypothetical protein ACIOWF_20470 [Cellulosimicrobium cellulans]|uniref:hypothetical protein n=1 Tax=Cellulosimicrobium cellulans TaxID=1710 RepID=UPI0037F1F8BB